MSISLNLRASPVRALLLSLCCYSAGGSWTACAQSSAPSEPEDVVRRYEHGIFMVHYQYAYAPLDDALEHSIARYGPYKSEHVTTEMSLARLHQEVLKGDLVNVVVLPLVEGRWMRG